MRRRNKFIFGAVAIVAILALAFWGFQEHRLRNLVTIHAENHYQQSFHELAYYVDSLEESLGMSLAMQSRDTMRPQLVETWRLSALAHAAANELPLTLLPFNRTNEFLAHVGEFTYNSGVKSSSDRKLSGKEYQTLQKLYRESKTISEGLREVQGQVMSRHLRWMDVEWALKGKKQNEDNQVIDGLKRIDGQATDYTQSFSPENPRNMVLEKKKFNQMTGPEITKDEAVGRLKKWLVLDNARVKRISETGKGSNEDFYDITINPAGGKPVAAAVTKKGGHVVWFISSRNVTKEEISLFDAVQRSSLFLKQHRMMGMQLTKRDQYQNVAVLTYVLKKGNVRFYPASVKIKVALDNGDILAFDQTDFLFNKSEGAPLKPKLSEQQVRRQINKDLKIQETNLAVFQNSLLKNVLCYEFFATKGDNTYRLLLNARNGDQEKVELLRN